MVDHDGASLDVRAHLLHEHCTRRLGDTHRATIVYDRDGLEGVHFRDDLRDAYSAARLEEFAETAWDVQSALLSIETDEDSLGGIEATVHSFESAFVIQFPVAYRGGILLSCEPSVGARLDEFLGSLETAMERR